MTATTYEEDLKEVSQKEEKEPKKRGRKGRQSNPEKEDFEPRKTEEPKTFASLEDLEAMPLKTHQDYVAYNEAVRKRRRVLRKKDVEFLYAPIDLVKTVKVKITRKKHRGLPININMRKLDRAVWFKSPKEGFKDGDIVMMPACIVDEINAIAEPKYKQIKYPDGSCETVLDYMDEKYSCQIMMGS